MTTHPAVRVGTTTMAGLSRTVVIFLAIIFPSFALVGVVAGLTGNDASMWQNAGAGAVKYFSLAMGVMLTTVFLPIYVAHGVTRRSVSGGGALFVVLWSAAIALAVTVGFAIEAFAFRASGRQQTFELPHLFTRWSDVHLIFTEYFVLTAAHVMVGWLIGTTYYRLGWFVPTLLLPLSLVPAAAVEVLLGTSWVGAGLAEFTDYTRPALAVGIPAALLVMGATWAVNFALIRNVAIKLKAA